MSYWTENEDKLKRAEESDYIIGFLTQQVSNRISRGRIGSYVLNIDATWGEGKTFFMQGLFADLKDRGHPAIIIDAWRDDFSDDPLTAVVAEFDNFLKSFKSSDRSVKARVKTAGKDFRRNVGKLSLLTAKGIAKRATTYVVGEAADEVVEVAKELVAGDINAIVKDASTTVVDFTNTKIDKYAERKLAQFNEAKCSLDNFQNSLGKAVKALAGGNYKNPFFILVDELDRCRPTYAIEMLERIKHLFEVENVVFILATDTTQLSNSIKAVYGSEFDSRHYLSRFFDRTYMLASPHRHEMVAYYFNNAGLDVHDFATGIEAGPLKLIADVCDQNRLEIRQIGKAIDLLATIKLVWVENSQIELALLFPMIVAFIRGNDLIGVQQKRRAFKVDDDVIRVSGCDLQRVLSELRDFEHTTLHGLKAHLDRKYGSEDLWRARDAETILAIKILSDEIDARGRINSFPLFTTYADRIRMAGRFTH